MNSYTETKIWLRLEKLKAKSQTVRTFIGAIDFLPRIETVLNKAASSPKDFTLHDAEHSFRVAERMWDIIPKATQKILSEYELMLLILSAYLHDIGMTPDYNLVNKHYIVLTSDNKSILTDKELNEFQRWLDTEGEEIDVLNNIVADSDAAAQLITFYCRYKHNDWSEHWIRENLGAKELIGYTNWIEDLVNICRSHHYGIEELKKERFNAYRIHGKVVHRRFLAMCLRLADVMEIDPERAPEVLIKYRNVIEGSLSHWLKEKFTSVEIVKGHITVTANPTKAFIHKAINEVAAQIEQEAVLCNILIADIPLNNISPSNDLEHSWDIIPSVHKIIRASGGYEFMDGAFRPNSKKLIELLAGTELYGRPILAIREVVQNAMDAVKVLLGFKIVNEEITDISHIDTLREKLSIEIKIFTDNGHLWLSCKDNGIGMDKQAIKNSFLVGGAVKRHEILDLERRCKKLGHNLGLTGKFGIGVLSYFMIADKIIIRTKKSSLSENSDGNGWEFEINGLSDFGELRQIALASSGTEIMLRLTAGFSKTIAYEDPWAYLQNLLVHLPCNLTFSEVPGHELKFKKDWCKDQSYYKYKLIEAFSEACHPSVNLSTDFISKEHQALYDLFSERQKTFEQDFEKSIRFLVSEGELGDGMGSYRIHIPVFENLHGLSFAFFFESPDKENIQLLRVNNGYLFRPEGDTVFSWKGIMFENKGNKFDRLLTMNAFVEINLTDGDRFKISVSRLDIQNRNDMNIVKKIIDDKITETIRLHNTALSSSPYALYNAVSTNYLVSDIKQQYWSYDNERERNDILVEKLSFPVPFYISTDLSDRRVFSYKGSMVRNLGKLPQITRRAFLGEEFSLGFRDFRFDKAVYVPYYNYRVAFIITQGFNTVNKYKFLGNSAEFPPQWKHLICFRGRSDKNIILNENYLLFKDINNEDYRYVENFLSTKSGLASEIAEVLLKSRPKAVCFIVKLISLNDSNIWDGIINSSPDFVDKLFTRLFGKKKQPIYFFHDDIAITSLVKISRAAWEVFSDDEKINEIMPIPGEDWKFTEEL